MSSVNKGDGFWAHFCWKTDGFYQWLNYSNLNEHCHTKEEQKCHNKDVWQEQFPTHESVHVSSAAQNIDTPKKNKMSQ